MELHFSMDITLLFCYTLFASGEAAVSRKGAFFRPASAQVALGSPTLLLPHLQKPRKVSADSKGLHVRFAQLSRRPRTTITLLAVPARYAKSFACRRSESVCKQMTLSLSFAALTKTRQDCTKIVQITLLESALTRTAPVSSLESALTKKGGGRGQLWSTTRPA